MDYVVDGPETLAALATLAASDGQNRDFGVAVK
jgi:hypothetical protein